MKGNNILEYVKFWSQETPNKNSYTFWSYKDNERIEQFITCKDLYDNSCVYAMYLKSIGINKGDRVIILAEQSPQTIYTIYGSLMIGAIFILVPVPKDTNKHQRLMTTIDSSGAKYIIYNGQEIKNKKDINIEFIDVSDILSKNIENIMEISVESINEDDIAFLQYTSGSVNAPKGIIYTHKNILAGVENLQSVYNLTYEEINVSWLPFYHAMGLILGIFYAAYINRQEIIMTTEVFQEKPIRWIRAISKCKATYVLGPNSAYMACVKMINQDNEGRNIDLSSVKYMINASEIIQKSNWETIWETFKQYGLKRETLTPIYGLSEATGAVTIGNKKINYLEADWQQLQKNKMVETKDEKNSRTLAGVGKIVGGLKTIIVDKDTLRECKEGEIGELWVQGDGVAKGYWNNKEATEQLFNAVLPNHKGTFLRTGDLGAIVSGEVYITGRIKEMMVINGRNIYAKDIELYVKAAIPELKNVVMYSFTVPIRKRERSVIGIEYIADEVRYNKLVADINNIIYEYFNFEAYDIFFVEPNVLPRTDNGKLAMMKIYHAYVGKELPMLFSFRKHVMQEKKTDFTKDELKVKEIFESILDIKCNSNKDNFLALGGTSLEVFNLIKRIKTDFMIKLTLRDIMHNPTIEGIANIVSEK